MKSRYCYNYIPPSPTTCNACNAYKPLVSASSDYLSSISCLSNVVNNNMQTSQGSFLLASQKQQKQQEQTALQSSTIQSTITNATSITNTLTSQLETVRNQRYIPYQPYIPPVIPSSVTELQMRTANAGVPMSVFTIANCKGSQFVTK
jgi:hypothetical protein